MKMIVYTAFQKNKSKILTNGHFRTILFNVIKGKDIKGDSIWIKYQS